MEMAHQRTLDAAMKIASMAVRIRAPAVKKTARQEHARDRTARLPELRMETARMVKLRGIRMVPAL
jgi:hypothetical protein